MGIYACPRCGNPNGWWSGNMRDVHDCPGPPRRQWPDQPPELDWSEVDANHSGDANEMVLPRPAYFHYPPDGQLWRPNLLTGVPKGAAGLYTEEQVRELLRTAGVALPYAPPGWKLVPVEPTEEMAYRGGEATAGRIEWDDAPDDAPDQLARAIYRAMLNAAPPGVPGTFNDQQEKP